MKIGKLSVREPRDWKIVLAVLLFCSATVIASSAQSFTTLLSFDGTDGSNPAVRIQGFDGNFYGTTASGGTNGYGTVFKLTPGGTLTTIYNFCAQTNCADGEFPYALVQGRDGNFYGTASGGGQLSCFLDPGCGTVFKLTPAGTLTVLHTFTDDHEGGFPNTLLQAADGNFYGTTGLSSKNDGTVFKINVAGVLTTLHTFTGSDGGSPFGLMQATDGNFYGITPNGGSGLGGTVFKMTPAGTLTTLVNFDENQGPARPSSLVQASDGNFYGTTTNTNSQSPYGTVFQMTPSGSLSVLYSFCRRNLNCPQGTEPDAVVQGTDGNLYGTTGYGGGHGSRYGCGTLFQITTTGTLTTLHAFENLTDGCGPGAPLLQATDGSFYGTTSGGGSNNGMGTIFNLNMALGPFVTTNPTSGKAGTKVGILGTNLKGATAVSFNGTAAKFSVVAKTTIVATVPVGATTGLVTVVTPSGTLTSNVPFQIAP